MRVKTSSSYEHEVRLCVKNLLDHSLPTREIRVEQTKIRAMFGPNLQIGIFFLRDAMQMTKHTSARYSAVSKLRKLV
jgi:hypothetical protein